MTKKQKCDVCRARKIKCDEASPACKQCRLGGRPCSYKAAEFGRTFLRHASNGDSGIQFQASRLAPDGEGTYSTFRITGAPLENRKSDTELSYPRQPSSLSQVLPSSAPAYRQQATMLYLQDEYPPQSLAPGDRDLAFSHHWFEPFGSTMQTAIDSLLLFHLSKTTHKRSLLHEGHTRYLQALGQLQKKIQSSDSAWNDDVFRATHILTIAGHYRQLVPVSHDLAAHMSGLESMIKARGPPCLKSNVILMILLITVTQMLQRALRKRRGHFLGEPQWQAVLHAKFYETRFGLLTTSAATLPILLYKADQLISTGPSQAVDAQSLLDSISEWKIGATTWLSSCYERDIVCIPVQCETFGKKQSTNERTKGHKFLQDLQDLTTSYPFPAFYFFDELSDATRHVWYWVMLLEAESAQLAIMTLHNPDSTQQMHDTFEQCDTLAANICQMVPYLHSTSGNAHSKDSVICFGLEHAERWYTRNGEFELVKWCRDIRHTIELCALTYLAV